MLFKTVVGNHDYRSMRKKLESLHGILHCLVGGSMCDLRSPADAVFFLHHNFVDRVWFAWQRNHPNAGTECGRCTEVKGHDGKMYDAHSYVGIWDTDLQCVKYPAHRPSVCLRYEKKNSLPQAHLRLLDDVQNGQQDDCRKFQQEIDTNQCSSEDLEAAPLIAECNVHANESRKFAAELSTEFAQNMHGPLITDDPETKIDMQKAGDRVNEIFKENENSRTRPAKNEEERITCTACDVKCTKKTHGVTLGS